MGQDTSKTDPPSKGSTPSQLYSSHLSAHPNPAHSRGMDQRLRTTPNPGTGFNTGGGGMRSFMQSFGGGMDGGRKGDSGGRGNRGSKL